MKNIIIHCPTKELFIKVQEHEFANGNCWYNGSRKVEDCWDVYRENTCISLLEGRRGEMTYCSKPFYEEDCPNAEIISANEYLDSRTPEERKDQPEGTTMNTLEYTLKLYKEKFRELFNFMEERTEQIEKCKRCGVPYDDHSCYLAPCPGCEGGHSSFWRTITRSPEWEAWKKEQARRFHTEKREGCFDYDECEACGYISEGHWREFVKFIKTL